jgi:DNA repair protein RecN (Recombination protein N)
VLRSLHIRDYALIESLEVEFQPGLNIVTGETGAGKSIVVGALKMILGERASTETIRGGARKAIIEGVFEGVDQSVLGPLLEEGGIEWSENLILRREIGVSQSRAFINDSPATVQLLRGVASCLVDLHGQHEHQSLLRTETHIEMLDAFGGLGGLKASYRESFDRVAKLVRDRGRLAARERDLTQQRDLWEFQIEEIDAVTPVGGEEDTLEADRRVLENAERLREATTGLFDVLYESDAAVYDRLIVARNELRELARIDSAFEPAFGEIESAQIAVSEIASFLQDYNARIEFNPERLEEIRERLGDLDRLKRRYGGSLERVIQHRQEIGEQFDLASDFRGALRRMDEEITAACVELSRMAERLSGKRRQVAARIETSIQAELAGLGMPDSVFLVSFEVDQDPGGWIRLEDGSNCTAHPDGMDRISFLISANPGVPPRSLARIASGGEISRIMLAMKSILAKSDRLPLLVFDEIDVGVSGGIAQAVGARMRDLARYHQIITITHLPQVAAQGDAHFRVEKEVADGRTRTGMRRLTEAGRLEEVASLVSGARLTEAALESARELIGARQLDS